LSNYFQGNFPGGIYGKESMPLYNCKYWTGWKTDKCSDLRVQKEWWDNFKPTEAQIPINDLNINEKDINKDINTKEFRKKIIKLINQDIRPDYNKHYEAPSKPLTEDYFNKWQMSVDNGMITFAENVKEKKEKQDFSAFKDTKIVDIFQDHNQAIDALKVAKDKGLITKPLTLVHFDTHSDILPGRGSDYENIASWVNKTLANGTVNDMYWVIPDWSKDKQVKNTFWNKKQNTKKYIFDSPIKYGGLNSQFDGQKNRILYVNSKTDEVYIKKPADYNTNDYKTVNFHKLTAGELPSFKGNKNVQVDFCGDYFGNTGFDTSDNASHNYTHNELNQVFSKTLKNLKQKDINPVIVTAALSRNYLPPEDEVEVKRFYQDIASNSEAKSSFLAEHEHTNTYSYFYKNLHKENKEISENSIYKSLYELSYIDAHNSADNKIYLDNNNKEENLATEKIQSIFALKDKETAKIIVESFDSADSQKDGVINIRDIEKNTSSFGVSPVIKKLKVAIKSRMNEIPKEDFNFIQDLVS